MITEEKSPQDEKLSHVIAGMLSTTLFVPAFVHPESMLELADIVIHHIRIVDEQSRQAGVDSIPQGPEGPLEGMNERF